MIMKREKLPAKLKLEYLALWRNNLAFAPDINKAGILNEHKSQAVQLISSAQIFISFYINPNLAFMESES
jgi:hypothetical protein